MARPITLFTGQWADLPLETLGTKGEQMGVRRPRARLLGRPLQPQRSARDEILQANAATPRQAQPERLGHRQPPHGPTRPRPQRPPHRRLGRPPNSPAIPRGSGHWAIEEMKRTARAARQARRRGRDRLHRLVDLAHDLPVPPVSEARYQEGLRPLRRALGSDPRRLQGGGRQVRPGGAPGRDRLRPLLGRGALEAVGHRPAFGFNFDPSHLIWQQVDPVQFIYAFPDRIFHVHAKDAEVTLDGRTGILSSTCTSATPAAVGTSARSAGATSTSTRSRALNQIGYTGPPLGRVGGQHAWTGSTARPRRASTSGRSTSRRRPAGSFEDAFKK